MIEIKFFCSHCGGKLLVDEPTFGLQINCPHCDKAILAPIGRLTGEQPPSAGLQGLGRDDEVGYQNKKECEATIREQEQRTQELRKQVENLQAILHI